MHSSKFLAPTCSYLLLARRLGVCPLWNVSASQNEMPCHSLGMKCSLTLQTSLLILGGSGANMNRTAFLKLSSTQNPDMQKWGPFIPPGAAIKWYDHNVFHFFLGCDELLWWDCRYLFYLREKKIILLVAAMTAHSRVLFACVKRGIWFCCLSHQSRRLWLGSALDGVRLLGLPREPELSSGTWGL